MPSKLKLIKDVADLFASQSTCSQRAAVGAVLFDDEYRIVATGYNGAPQGFPHCNDVGCVTDDGGHCIAAVHAEMNAIMQCAVYGVRTRGLNLYTTHTPCERCAIMIVRAGIKSVVFTQVYGRVARMRNTFMKAGIPYSQFGDFNA